MYRVVLTGKTLVGTSAEQAVVNFSAIFRIPVDRARSAVGRRVVVRRRIDQNTAQGHVGALQKGGLDAFFEFDDEAQDSVTAASPNVAPSSQQPPPVPPTTLFGAPVQGTVPPLPQTPSFGATKVEPPPLPPDAAQTAVFDVDRSRAPVVQASGIGEFLTSIGLTHLNQLFNSHALTREMLTDLSDADLQSMGISSLGERKRILGAVRQAQEDEKAQQAVSIYRESERDGVSSSQGLFVAYGLASVLIAFGVWSYAGASVGLIAGAVSFVVLWIYFLPTQIAFRKQSEHRWAILIGNIFFGGTVFGWVVLLVFAKRLVSGKAAATIGVVGAIAGGL